MSRLLNQLVKITPGLLGCLFLVAQSAIASPKTDFETANPETINPDEALGVLRNRPQMDNPMNRTSGQKFNTSASQVTSVSELRDVQPTEWAYEALRSLVERYGCIVGYPDRTFRGNRALSRWEFAAGLNACLNTIERLLQENVAVLREDIEKLKRLAQEFEAELAALGSRVSNLESRVSYLEDHQFSTTTQLKATSIFTWSNAWGERALDYREQDTYNQAIQNRRNTTAKRRLDDNSTLGYRVRLNFNTSFSGKDMLTARLQALTIVNYANPTGTSMARLGHDANNDSNVVIDNLWYRFPIGQFTGYVGGTGLDVDDIFDTGNPYGTSSDTGALSRFMRYDPLTMRGTEGIGAGFAYKFNDMFTVRGLYLTPGGEGNDPSQGRGLFNGSFTAGGQIGFKPTDGLTFNAQFLHKYFRPNGVNVTHGTGSGIASDPFLGAATITDNYGLNGNWRINETFNLTGWVGYALARGQGLDSRGRSRRGLGADIWSWMVGLNVIDLFKEGAVFSVGGGSITNARRVDALTGDLTVPDQDTPYIIEGQYRYPLNKNIDITPGLYVILEPDGNNQNNSIWVGVVRTTFKF
ncbi:Carbohydrate-selective porin OprB [Rippkaea orientalis PCC 8801]|uniref:Carbohydrate-selective porin OprB n=1 Tax=Rippkaea orientalis (strain PCC 8801 / RF-1) TaxID=41431 RepID=B7K661_RIPO1|nr:iron uptake porin [Rippkaea orientalis]ACK68114.1 Carbohydrate-selective porin OprB [Rippkaea orientalis PCC 8801]